MASGSGSRSASVGASEECEDVGVPGRDNTQCMQRYTKVLRPGIKKGTWSPEEDRLLLEWVKRLGTGNCEEIASHIEGRSAGKCRERYTNYIGPDVKKG